jgi:hypothetical protein
MKSFRYIVKWVKSLQGARCNVSRFNYFMTLQVIDFSPVRTIFELFDPISQPEGFDFPPVTRIPGKNFSAGCQRAATGLHPV